jgi:hypothetical protein
MMDSRHIGRFNAFNEDWFTKHQNILIKILNHPISKKLSRWILRIHCDLLPDENIIDIHPNRYTVILGDDTYRTDFRTHDKFAKRIYFAARPVWLAMHFLDWILLDRVCPKLSFGLSTLTAYPEVGGGGSNTTTDGYLRRLASFGENFSDIRVGVGTNANPTTSENYMIELSCLDSSSTDPFDYMDRGMFTFNTASLGSVAVISSAVFSFWETDKLANIGAIDVHCGAATPANSNNLVAADYSQIGRISFASIVYASLVNSAYNDMTLNASGITNINKTGVSCFSTQSQWDINNSTVGINLSSSSWSSVNCRYADYSGLSNDPKLVITYTGGIKKGNQNYGNNPTIY